MKRRDFAKALTLTPTAGSSALAAPTPAARRKELSTPPYAEFLTGLGMSALCIDTWIFGERATRIELDSFKETLWKGQVLWGMMVYDSLRALDYLVARPEVEPSRVATLGLSMGSTMAWWTAALDERIKVCVDICCPPPPKSTL